MGPTRNCVPTSSDATALVRSWMNSPYPTIKNAAYFEIYAELFKHLRGSDCTFIETGVLDGGSLFMWRDWLGNRARIVGIDLNPDAVRWREFGFEVFIGDQADSSFWHTALASVGSFDVLLDDGGHQSFQQIVTACEALRDGSHRCLVVVEDTGTSFMSDFADHGRHSFLEFSKAATDCLTGRLFDLEERKGRYPTRYNKRMVEFFRNVMSIQFFSGIVAYHVDPERCTTPRILRNKPSNGAPDCRYSGCRSAAISWPDINAGYEVTIGRANDDDAR